MRSRLLSVAVFSFQPYRLSQLLLAIMVGGIAILALPLHAQQQDDQRLSVEQRQACRSKAAQAADPEEQKRLFRQCRRATLDQATPSSVPAAAPPAVAAHPSVAAPAPVAAPPAAPVPPPAAPAASVAASPIPASLLPAASPKAEAGTVAPAPGNDTAVAAPAPVAAPPIAPPAAPVPPPAAPAASVATSPIPASLLPAASPKAEAGAVAPAPGNDTAVAAPVPVAAPPAAPVPPPAAPAASVATSPIPASLLPAASPKAEAGAVAPAPGNDTTAVGSGNSDLVEVVAQGMGTDQTSALNNAYSNAVQQALGLYVDAETMVQNDQIVRDQILTYSKGFIQNADIVSQSQANGLFQVNIRAKVQRQQLLEKAKASNITIKQVEGVSLHARVASQLKQEQDAKALLEKTLLPLMDATLLRAELVPHTEEQPNPTINKEATNDQFVTLDYKVSLWIDESAYFNYVKNTLIPVLNKIAVRKGELTANYRMVDSGPYAGTEVEGTELYNKEIEAIPNKESSFNVLIWKDKLLTSSKWQWFFISQDKIPEFYNKSSSSRNNKYNVMICAKAIELSLLDEKNETIVLGKILVGANGNDCDGSSSSPLALQWRGGKTRISPYFTKEWSRDSRFIVPPKSGYFTISIKIPKEDLPRVKSAKLEVKSAEE